VLVVSTDGLVMQKSSSLDTDEADPLAAVTSAVYGGAAAAGRQLESGQLQRAVIELQQHTILIASAGENARLTVVCTSAVELGTVVYEMRQLITRIGQHLGAEARPSTSVSNGHNGA
jgi:predicted regulator of Ras-like GTPase activity (Roadblock/LC7/MglB family)